MKITVVGTACREIECSGHDCCPSDQYVAASYTVARKGGCTFWAVIHDSWSFVRDPENQPFNIVLCPVCSKPFLDMIKIALQGSKPGRVQ